MGLQVVPLVNRGCTRGTWNVRSWPRHCRIESRRAKVVATVLSHVRCHVSGVLGMAPEERKTPCCSLVILPAHAAVGRRSHWRALSRPGGGPATYDKTC